MIFLCGLVPVLVAAALAVYRPGPISRLDDNIYDILLRSAPTTGPGSRVVIVDVDERSLSTLGQWPWRRDRIAALIDRLRSMGAAIVALDIIFAEPDRFTEVTVAEHRSTASSHTPDDTLAAALGRGRVILGYGLTFDGAARSTAPCVLHPASVAIVQPPGETIEPPYFRATGGVCNLPALATAAGASGFLNAAPDPDGILRRVPLVAELDGRLYPGLAVAAVMAATGARHMTLRVANVNDSTLAIDDRTVPLDARSNLLLRYRGKKRTFPYVSAADVLSGEADRGAVQNKIVFVGTTALGTREVVATPLDTLFAGVEVQATVADNLLAGDFISRSSLGRTAEAAGAVAAGTAVAALAAGAGLVAGLIGGAITAVAVWWGAVWLLAARGLFVSPLFPTFGILLGLAVMTLANFTVERRRADRAGRERTAARGLMVQTLLSLTEVRDAETGRHSLRTQRYTRLLAEQLSTSPAFRTYLTRERIDLLSNLAPLHDIGKVGVPDHILNKPGALTPDELAEMRKHPALGREVILKAEQRAGVRDDETLAMAKDIVYTHHERWDGTGYPQGLRGAAIPVAGRVMAVVDVYDAANTRSLYRSALSHEETVKLIAAGQGTHFDPAVVEAFIAVADRFRSVSDEANVLVPV